VIWESALEPSSDARNRPRLPGWGTSVKSDQACPAGDAAGLLVGRTLPLRLVPALHFFQCLVRDFVQPRIVANQVRQETVGHNAHQIRNATLAAEVLQELARASSSSSSVRATELMRLPLGGITLPQPVLQKQRFPAGPKRQPIKS